MADWSILLPPFVTKTLTLFERAKSVGKTRRADGRLSRTAIGSVSLLSWTHRPVSNRSSQTAGQIPNGTVHPHRGQFGQSPYARGHRRTIADVRPEHCEYDVYLPRWNVRLLSAIAPPSGRAPFSDQFGRQSDMSRWKYRRIAPLGNFGLHLLFAQKVVEASLQTSNKNDNLRIELNMIYAKTSGNYRHGGARRA